MAMQFFKKIGDMLEVDDGVQESGREPGATPDTPLQTLEEMLHLPEEEAGKEARAAAELLQNAAKASEALAQQLPEALKRARKAEMEAQKLRETLAEAETKMAEMQAQQLRLADGLLGEIRQRDAELALLRVAAAAAATAPAPAPGGEEEAAAKVQQEQEVVTLNEGVAVDFHRSTSSKLVASSSELMAGDEVLSLNGLSAKNMSWEEFDLALAHRPVVLTVQRERRQGGIAAKMRSFSVWTRDKAKAVARELDAAMADMQEDAVASNLAADPSAAAPGTMSFSSSRPASTDEVQQEEEEDAEARNRPFYDLVKASMAEPAGDFVAAGAAGSSAAFETWLRQFHNDRDDEWFENNRTRVYNAFRPHWDEVVQSAKDRAERQG